METVTYTRDFQGVKLLCLSPSAIQDCIKSPLPRKGTTASGYGSAIPMQYKIRVENKWYRVKAMVFGNSGTLYITRKKDAGYDLLVEGALNDYLANNSI